MHIFPESGFDQSATTPVFLGVLVSWLLTESFGWVFAALVVPGYLATLFVLDPRSAAIDVGEAVLTYAIARLLGEHLSRTGLTSRAFGRERFLLVVTVSILVRLGLEGVAFAYLVPRATWAYSIGLVVVPLAANACWKTGLLRGAVRTGVPTAIVYGLLRYVLVPHTNLSLAGFHLATENIAASFLASPKAYLVLLTGALLAATANLRYGWDYNGILLPALLALVIANPAQLLATLAEIFLLLWIMRGLLQMTPVGRWNIEGPRRPMLFFSVDYALRFGFAALVGRSLPGTGFAEASGFGYLLPTLLAVKISQKGIASLVLLPTAIVSVAAFALGNVLGFAADRLDSGTDAVLEASSRAVASAPDGAAAAALWLSALARHGTLRASEHNQRPAMWLGQLADALLAGAHAQVPPDVAVQHLDGGMLLLRERFEDAERRLGTPSVLLAPAPARGRIVALVEEPLAAPETAALAGHLLGHGVVDAVVIAGVEGDPQRASAGAPSARMTARALAEDQALLFRRRGMVVVLRLGASADIRFTASERMRNEPRVRDLAAALHARVGAASPAPSARLSVEDAVIDVPPGYAGAWLDAVIRPVSLKPAAALAMAFDALPAAKQRAMPEDLLALRRLVLTPLLSATTQASALAVIRTSATALGYALLGPSRMSETEDAVVLRPRAAAGAIALAARLQKRSGVVVEVPLGAHEALRALALRLAARLDADVVLVGLDPDQGALGNAAFAEAHAAAVWSAREPGASIVTLRTAALDTKGETSAELGSWGGDAGVALAGRCGAALAELGIQTRGGALDPATREQAGRSVFGLTPLVSVTVDPQLLRSRAWTRAEPVLEAFASFPVLDQENAELALQLARDLPASMAPAPSGLLDAARRAAFERSIVARRALEAAIANTSSKAAIARASGGVFLVVVGRRAHELIAGAFPLALAIGAELAPPLRSPTLEGCRSVLDRGGVCSVEDAR